MAAHDYVTLVSVILSSMSEIILMFALYPKILAEMSFNSGDYSDHHRYLNVVWRLRNPGSSLYLLSV
jgi:hypothetical protein